MVGDRERYKIKGRMRECLDGYARCAVASASSATRRRARPCCMRGGRGGRVTRGLCCSTHPSEPAPCAMAASEVPPRGHQALGDLLEFVFGLDAKLGPMPADPKQQMRGLLAWLLETDVAALEVEAPYSALALTSGGACQRAGDRARRVATAAHQAAARCSEITCRRLFGYRLGHVCGRMLSKLTVPACIACGRNQLLLGKATSCTWFCSTWPYSRASSSS